MAVRPLWFQYMLAVPGTITVLLIGKWFDKQGSLHMTRFRDKSALYGRELKPGEPHSWP